jgi:hypothetical protein
MITYVYKIVRTDTRRISIRLLSGYAYTSPLPYRVGKRTVPKFGKLFAFRTLKAARAYSEGSSGLYRIYQSRATGVTRPPRFIGYASTEVSQLKSLWRDFNDGLTIRNDWYRLQRPPRGTVCCDSITLIREIKYA